MSSGEYRRSARISKLDARKAQQAKSLNEGNRTINSGKAQGQVARQNSNQKLGRKRKTRHVHDLVDNDVESQVQKTGTLSDGDHHTTAAVDMSSRTPMPERIKLELLLDRLKRRDSYRIFAEPVNGEEVEGYYDVIKNPMDFSTITQKLNAGEYKTLKEFEHDILLVYKNAMQFNASDTIYYKQGHAIKELANKLFQTLKNDPESFETECSMRRVGPGRRTKAVAGSLNLNSCNKTTGCRDERGSENCEQQRRWTYSPRTSFLNDNGPLVAQVYSSSQKLELVKENKIGYAKSLMRFANNLGPTAQLVAQRKLGSGIAETPPPQTAASNCHFHARTNAIPSVASAHENIITVPSLKLPGNSTDCQRFSGREVDKHSALNGGKVSAVKNAMDIYDVLRGGIAHASSTMKALGQIHGRMAQAHNKIPAAVSGRKSITVAPSVKILGHSAGKEFNGQHHALSGQKIPVLETVNKCGFTGRAITYASSRNENLDNARDKMVQTVTGGSDLDTAKESISMSEHEKLDFPADWDTDSNPNKFSFVKLMLDAINDSPDHTSEVVFSGSKVQDSVPASISCPSSSSLHWPVQATPGGSSQASGFMHYEDSRNLGVYQLMQEGGGPANWLKLNIEGGSSGTQTFSSMQGIDLNYLGELHQMQATVDKAGPSHGGNAQPGGQVPNWLKPKGLGSDAAGASHGSTINGAQFSNWLKPTALGPQPVLNDWFQLEGKSSAEADSLCQAEFWQQQGWGITSCDGKMIKPSNVCDNDKHATSGQGQLRIGAPADNLQKQPLWDSCHPHWTFHP